MHDVKGKDKTDIFQTIITVGFVVHVPVENLSDLKKAVSGVPGITPVFFKTSAGRLWIREGDER